MDHFKYTLKLKEAKEATTKKKRKELFNEAADNLPWWTKEITAEQTLWFKIATYMLLHHKKDVVMIKRVERINHYAGKITTAYASKNITLTAFQNAFEFTNSMSKAQIPSLNYILRMDRIPYEVKFSIGKMIEAINE